MQVGGAGLEHAGSWGGGWSMQVGGAGLEHAGRWGGAGACR